MAKHDDTKSREDGHKKSDPSKWVRPEDVPAKGKHAADNPKRQGEGGKDPKK